MNIKDTLFLTPINSTANDWFGYYEVSSDEFIDSTFFKFDNNPDSLNTLKPLYEIDIVFLDIVQAEEYLNKNLVNN